MGLKCQWMCVRAEIKAKSNYEGILVPLVKGNGRIVFVEGNGSEGCCPGPFILLFPRKNLGEKRIRFFLFPGISFLSFINKYRMMEEGKGCFLPSLNFVLTRNDLYTGKKNVIKWHEFGPT